jgi:hypothetical protein
MLKLREIAGENQRGFIPGRSTLDNIWTILRRRELAKEFRQTEFFVFVDVKSAFDTIDRAALVQVLIDNGMSLRMVERLKDTMSGTSAVVRTSSAISERYTTDAGVPQGSASSPPLFGAGQGHCILGIEWACRSSWFLTITLICASVEESVIACLKNILPWLGYIEQAKQNFEGNPVEDEIFGFVDILNRASVDLDLIGHPVKA